VTGKDDGQVQAAPPARQGRMKRVGRMRRSVLADRVVAAEYRLDRRVGLDRFRSTIRFREADRDGRAPIARPDRCRKPFVMRDACSVRSFDVPRQRRPAVVAGNASLGDDEEARQEVVPALGVSGDHEGG